MALSTRMCRNSPSAQSRYTVSVDTWRYAATSFTVSSVRNLSAESSVNDAKACDCLESKPAASRVVASGCEALLLPGCASSGLRSRGPGVRLLHARPRQHVRALRQVVHRWPRICLERRRNFRKQLPEVATSPFALIGPLWRPGRSTIHVVVLREVHE